MFLERNRVKMKLKQPLLFLDTEFDSLPKFNIVTSMPHRKITHV